MSTLSYEVAKKLKEAGFPQKLGLCAKAWVDGEHSIIINFPIREGVEYIYDPTLSELLRECGAVFWRLMRDRNGKWRVQGRSFEVMPPCDTPEEAVANLFISLHGTK